jgi:hypothetical protein
MISFSELAKKLAEGVMQPNGTDKVDYDKGMDGNPQNPDKKNKKSRGSDIKILNGEQEPPIKEDKAYIEQHLADKDINASVSGNTVKVHSSDVAATKKHLAKAGYNHKVVGGLNEAMYVEQSRAESGELFKSLVDRAHASSKAGNHTQAKRHLANAQTARYGITSGNMAKHKASFDKYKELKNSYTNSDDHVREDISIDEDLQPHQLKQIHKEYQYHKSRSTADVLKTHKGMHRVQSQNYTAGEMGGKEGLISDIMQHKHGKTRMTAYHALPSAQKKALSETEAVMPSYTKEETLDEISKDTLRSYANKAFAHGNDLHYDIDHTSDKDEKAKLRAKLSKRNDGVIRASQKLRKEDMDEAAIDHQHRIARDTVKNPNKSLLGGPSAKEAEETLRKKYGYDDKKIAKLKEAIDTVKRDEKGKVIAWSHEGDWEKMSTKKQGQGKAANLAGRAMQQTKKLTKEEKDEGEYGYEGDMAISQLKTICRHSEHLMGMLKPDTDLPEWVQSKITLATDYMQTAHDYMMSEMNESLDEEQLDELIRLQKATHTSNPFGAQHKDAENPNDRIRLARDAKDNRAHNRRGHSPEGSNYDPNRRGAASVKTVHNDVKANRSTDYISKKLSRPADKNKSWNESLNEAAHVYDTKTGKVHSTHDTYRKAINAMNKLNDKHPGYDTPGGLVQSKFGAKRVNEDVDLEEKGLWDNIHAKRKRIAAGSGEKMRKPGSKGAPSAQDLKDAQVKEDLDEAAWGRDKMTSLRQAHDRHMEKALAANKAGDDVAVKTHQRKMQMIQGKMQKLKQNEEVELGEECEILSELSKNTLGRYVKHASRDQSHKTALAQAYSQHDLGKTIDMDRIANRRKKGIDKAVDKLTKEEIEDFMQTEEYEELDELSKKTLGSYVKKAALSQHYDNKNFNSKETNNKDTQSNDEKIAGVKKSSKRTMGVMNAVNRLTKEEIEDFMQTEEYDQLDEISKDTLKSYVGKASQNARIQGMMQMDYAHRSKKAKSSGMKNAWDKMSRDAMKTGWKREDGIKTAVNKLTKEDNMLTYSEFMAQLLEGRADDLKDKLAADREARLNNYDYSKEKAAKKSPVQKVKGHSYGAGEEEGEDDEGSTKTVKPASEKRGRGRPAGSKSGARV